MTKFEVYVVICELRFHDETCYWVGVNFAAATGSRRNRKAQVIETLNYLKGSIVTERQLCYFDVTSR